MESVPDSSARYSRLEVTEEGKNIHETTTSYPNS
jgi:hypothetical protein